MKDATANTNNTNIPSKLATPNDLGEKVRDAVSIAINPIVADAFALYVKTKNFHWHLSGNHFRDYHLMLDEQADQVFAMIDILAERVRKVGGLTIKSIGHIHHLSHIKDADDNFIQPKEMLKKLIEDNQGFLGRLRAAHEICASCNDVGTSNVLENYIDETERRIWFLFETLSD